MAIDDPSAQLFDDIDTSVQDALATGRPVLHHLNADSSWLLQLPRPESAIKHGGRVYYNVLLDPWFTGPQSDLASWFSQQFHATASAIQSVSDLEELARDTEIAASRLRVGAKRKSNAEADRENGTLASSYVDAVAISHEFTDHCHQETLLELDKSVPVFAVKQAADKIRSWKYFNNVIAMPDFGKNGELDWRSTSVAPLPEWIGISRLLSKDDQLDYHSAVMITWNNRRHGVQEAHVKTLSGSRKRHHDTIEPNEDDEAAEALIYTPHGVQADSIDVVPNADPKIRPLAFLHGQHNVKIQSTFGTALQLNLGSHNGLAAQRKLKAKYWIGTHDEVKRGGGVVAWFLQRTVITVKDALEQEARRLRDDEPPLKAQKTVNDPDGVLDSFKDCNWLELHNGESRILA